MTTEYKYDVGEERAKRVRAALREAGNPVPVPQLRHVLNLFAADLAENPVEPIREQWAETGGVFSNLQRVMFRVPQEPPFDPEKVTRYHDSCFDNPKTVVSVSDYDKLLALYKEAVKK